jgi:hypothetical protein
MTTIPRDLTTYEKRVVNLVRLFDEYADLKRLFIKVVATHEQAEQISKMAKVLRLERHPDGEKLMITFLLPEYRRYVDTVARLAALKINLDGTVQTHDGYTLAPEDFKQ